MSSCINCDCWDLDKEGCIMPECCKDFACSLNSDISAENNHHTYEENERAKLIDYITEELDKDLLDSYETDFLRDLVKFIEGYGYI